MFNNISLSAIQLPASVSTQGLFQAAVRHKAAVSLVSAFFVVAIVALTIQAFTPTSSAVPTYTYEEPVAYQPSQAVSKVIRPSYLPSQ